MKLKQLALQESQLASGPPGSNPFQDEEILDFSGEKKPISVWQGSNHVFQKKKEMQMEAAMNINLPAARGIINPHNNSTANIKIAYQRKNASPLGNFWRRNLEDVFKDFWVECIC